jgi:UDP-glucose 4-epimerase
LYYRAAAGLGRGQRGTVRHLITGGGGFIGSHLADALVARGDSVLILDDFSTGRRSNIEHLLEQVGVELVTGSILDSDLVDASVRRVDSVCHLASAVGVQLIVREPLDSLITNMRGNDIVISAAARHGKRLLFTSTSEVYGKNGAGPLHENSDRVLGSPLKSRWSYATSKALGEALVHAYFVERGASMVVVRLFNTIGPRQSGAYGMVLPRLVSQALRGDNLTVYGEGTQTRCFVHVADTVTALVQLIDADAAAGNVYNVGSSQPVTILELARRVIEQTGSESEITFVPYDHAYEPGFEELGRRVPDTAALHRLTGWRPNRRLEETIRDVIAFERGIATLQVTVPEFA